LAPLRQQQFFSLAEINAAIAPLLTALNARPMREYAGQSRWDRFLRDDQPVARPLPVDPFQVNDACYALKVPANYLLKYDRHYYSVPHTVIDHHVDLFLTGDLLEIYHHGTPIACHAKQPPNGRQSLTDAHQPEHHRRVRQGSKAHFLHVAAVIGPFTLVLIEGIYTRAKHDEQANRTAQSVIRLCKQYPSERVEAAAERALYFRRATLKDVKQILTHGLDQQPFPGAGQRHLPLLEHANLRGPAYYQGE
jgi:hypothetical protein